VESEDGDCEEDAGGEMKRTTKSDHKNVMIVRMAANYLPTKKLESNPSFMHFQCPKSFYMHNEYKGAFEEEEWLRFLDEELDCKSCGLHWE
jgi:hypothetical protein